MKEDVEEQRGIGLSLLGELVLSLHDEQPFAQFPHVLDHLQGVKVSLAPRVHMEDLLGVPNETTEVDRQGHLEGEGGGGEGGEGGMVWGGEVRGREVRGGEEGEGWERLLQ